MQDETTKMWLHTYSLEFLFLPNIFQNNFSFIESASPTISRETQVIPNRAHIS